jgi:hypothetical protein
VPEPSLFQPTSRPLGSIRGEVGIQAHHDAAVESLAMLLPRRQQEKQQR